GGSRVLAAPLAGWRLRVCYNELALRSLAAFLRARLFFAANVIPWNELRGVKKVTAHERNAGRPRDLSCICGVKKARRRVRRSCHERPLLAPNVARQGSFGGLMYSSFAA